MNLQGLVFDRSSVDARNELVCMNLENIKGEKWAKRSVDTNNELKFIG